MRYLTEGCMHSVVVNFSGLPSPSLRPKKYCPGFRVTEPPSQNLVVCSSSCTTDRPHSLSGGGRSLLCPDWIFTLRAGFSKMLGEIFVEDKCGGTHVDHPGEREIGDIAISTLVPATHIGVHAGEPALNKGGPMTGELFFILFNRNVEKRRTKRCAVFIKGKCVVPTRDKRPPIIVVHCMGL